jgi:hypothetical protein
MKYITVEMKKVQKNTQNFVPFPKSDVYTIKSLILQGFLKCYKCLTKTDKKTHKFLYSLGHEIILVIKIKQMVNFYSLLVSFGTEFTKFTM